MAATGSEALGAAPQPLPDRLPLVIGVTGHRNIAAQNVAALEAKVAEIIARIRRDYLYGDDETPLILLSPLAEGADRIAARVALRAGLRLIAPLPMPAEEYRRDFEPGVSHSAAIEFDELLAQAIATPVLPYWPGVTLDDVRRDSDKRALQYRAVGVFVVQHCDVLIALWDGNENDPAVGGTAEIVKFKRQGMPLSFTDSAHASLDGSEVGPVIHVITPRDRANTAVNKVAVKPWGKEVIALHRGGRWKRACRSVGAFVASLVWIEFEDTAKRLDKSQRDILDAWECFESLVALTRGFNSEAAALLASRQGRDEIARNVERLVADPDTGALDERTKSYAFGHTPRWWTLYGAADVLAQCGQKSFRRDWLLVFVLGFAAFFVFASVMHVHTAGLHWLGVYVALVASLFAVVWWARYRGDQDHFLDYRALAEALRIALYWSLLGIDRSKIGIAAGVSGRPSSDTLMTSYPIKQPNELMWVKACLRKLDWLREAEIKPVYVLDPQAFEIARRCWVYGQFKYFARQGQRHGRRAEWLEGLSLTLLAATAVLVLILLWIDDEKSWLVLAVGVVPGLAAALAGYSERLAYSAQALQYNRMQALFGRAYDLLPTEIGGMPAQLISSLFLELGTEAMKENAEWVTIYRQRPMRPVQ